MDAATPLPVTSETSATLAWARRNAQAVTALAVYGIALGFALAVEFIQDSWLAIAGGRDIAQHGLPWHERLTVAAHGQSWVDQQWLGKLFLYFTTTVGGVATSLIAADMVPGWTGLSLARNQSSIAERSSRRADACRRVHWRVSGPHNDRHPARRSVQARGSRLDLGLAMRPGRIAPGGGSASAAHN